MREAQLSGSIILSRHLWSQNFERPDQLFRPATFQTTYLGHARTSGPQFDKRLRASGHYRGPMDENKQRYVVPGRQKLKKVRIDFTWPLLIFIPSLWEAFTRHCPLLEFKKRLSVAFHSIRDVATHVGVFLKRTQNDERQRVK